MQPYVAKLADFGGSVIEAAQHKTYLLLTKTDAFAAPEADKQLSSSAAKQTDVYSFGLLVWRVFIDGRLSSIQPEFASDDPRSKRDLAMLKVSGELLSRADQNVQEYATLNNLPFKSLDLVRFVLRVTIQAEPSRRSLSHAQAAVRGIQYV